MNKSLAAIFALAIITAATLGGWLWFESQSVLGKVEFSQKSVDPLNPTLPIQVLNLEE